MVSRSTLTLTALFLSVTLSVTPSLATEEGASEHGKPYVGYAPTHFPAGELVPEGDLVVLYVRDHVTPNAGALFCQAPPEDDVPCLPDDRTAQSFCGAVSLFDGRNWQSELDTYVYAGYHLDRFAPGVPCTPNGATAAGEITWWPGPSA